MSSQGQRAHSLFLVTCCRFMFISLTASGYNEFSFLLSQCVVVIHRGTPYSQSEPSKPLFFHASGLCVNLQKSSITHPGIMLKRSMLRGPD
jgi:hypothetical protein